MVKGAKIKELPSTRGRCYICMVNTLEVLFGLAVTSVNLRTPLITKRAVGRHKRK